MPNIDVTRIAGNIGALNALNSLQYVNSQLAIHQTRLATGKRINEAADDPAGMNMAITFDIRRNDMKIAINAIGDAKSLLAIAETGLRKISDILVKLKNKVMEAAGATIGDNERKAIAVQLNQFASEIDQIVEAANWNANDLIGTSASAVRQFFVGVSGSGTATFADFQFTGTGSAANADFSQGFTTAGLGIKSGSSGDNYSYTDIQFGTGQSGSATLQTIQDAIQMVKYGIVEVGSMSARLSFKEEAMTSAYINTEAAYNRIMNANMAEEQVNASKFLILQQTATAMLAQANLAPQFILQLFR
jgi:flagellin